MTLLQTLFSFNGRIGRGPFWLCIVALTLIDAAVLLVAQDGLRSAYPMGGGAPQTRGLIAGGAILLTLALSAWAGLALKVKRLHDRGRSGLYILAAVIPVVGWLWLLWEIGFAPGRKSGARFDSHSAEEDEVGAGQAAFTEEEPDSGAGASYGVLAAEPAIAAATEQPSLAVADAAPETAEGLRAPAAEADPVGEAESPAPADARSQIAEYLSSTEGEAAVDDPPPTAAQATGAAPAAEPGPEPADDGAPFVSAASPEPPAESVGAPTAAAAEDEAPGASTPAETEVVEDQAPERKEDPTP